MDPTAYSPYTYTENFDSPELNGFAGLFVSYLYNTDDERVMKISPQWVTKYITVGNGQVLAEYDGYNNLQYNYIFGNGEKLAKINTGGTKEYYHNDYLGSVRRISTQGGSAPWRRDYYPFGETRYAYGANENNLYTYEGKEKDLETNSWNNWKRHFNDEGRFTQVDPLWSKYPSLSPYVRVANNPLRFVDEDGRIITNANSIDAQYLKYSMSLTSTGTQNWNNMINSSRLITIQLSNKAPMVKKEDGKLKPKYGDAEYFKSSDGVENVTVSIYMGHSNDNSGEINYTKYSLDEYVNIVGTHEAAHSTENKKRTKGDNENRARYIHKKSKKEIDNTPDEERGRLKIRRIY